MPYAHRMLFAVVDVDWDGVELLDDWQMLGMRSTISCGVRFTDVFVPDDHVVGTPVGGSPRTLVPSRAAMPLTTSARPRLPLTSWPSTSPTVPTYGIRRLFG